MRKRRSRKVRLFPTTDTERLSWVTSMFYFGMLAGLYTMTFTLQRFNLERILGVVVIIWALVCMFTAID